MTFTAFHTKYKHMSPSACKGELIVNGNGDCLQLRPVRNLVRFSMYDPNTHTEAFFYNVLLGEVRALPCVHVCMVSTFTLHSHNVSVCASPPSLHTLAVLTALRSVLLPAISSLCLIASFASDSHFQPYCRLCSETRPLSSRLPTSTAPTSPSASCEVLFERALMCRPSARNTCAPT